MIVPLWSGSGIRIKILEAMALGKTIISTTIGASGINYQNKKNILIADTAEQFANQIFWCFNNPSESQKIGENAKLNIQENYSSETIELNLSAFLNKIQSS
jgi:glycosyltransferase involved in cell wall biosynthesis